MMAARFIGITPTTWYATSASRGSVLWRAGAAEMERARAEESQTRGSWMPMYHAWHSQNAWLRQILSHNRLYVNRARAQAMGLAENDWVWVTSHHSRLKCQIRLMEGVNRDTVWTWNAIGKSSGAWNLPAN